MAHHDEKKEINCICCDKKLSMFTRHKLDNSRYICSECIGKSGKSIEDLRVIETLDIKNLIKDYERSIEEFKPTKKIKNYIYIDENNKTWAIPETFMKVHKYSDIVDFQLIENNNVVSNSTTETKKRWIRKSCCRWLVVWRSRRNHWSYNRKKQLKNIN